MKIQTFEIFCCVLDEERLDNVINNINNPDLGAPDNGGYLSKLLEIKYCGQKLKLHRLLTRNPVHPVLGPEIK